MDSKANMIQTVQNQIAQLQNRLANTPNILQQVGQLQQQVTDANTARVEITAANNNIGNNNNLKTAKPETVCGTTVRTWLKSINNVFESLNSPSNEQQKIKILCKLFNWRWVTMVGTCCNK